MGDGTTLWDTSVLIDPPAEAQGTVMISIVSVLELGAGVNAARDPQTRADRLGLLTRVLSSFDPLPLDIDVATAYLAVDAAVRAAGRQPRRRLADLQIAATAVAHGLPLLTRNPADLAGLERLLPVSAP